MGRKLNKEFFNRDIRVVADQLMGKLLVRVYDDGRVEKYRITELEMYIGEEDLACHAAKGRTKRTEVMYAEGGKVYVYLIYGMYWLFNIVTGEIDQPQAILIRSIEGVEEPGRVGKLLELTTDFYGENMDSSLRIWLEDDDTQVKYICSPRINIDYAGEVWKNKLYRYKSE